MPLNNCVAAKLPAGIKGKAGVRIRSAELVATVVTDRTFEATARAGMEINPFFFWCSSDAGEAFVNICEGICGALRADETLSPGCCSVAGETDEKTCEADDSVEFSCVVEADDSEFSTVVSSTIVLVCSRCFEADEFSTKAADDRVGVADGS